MGFIYVPLGNSTLKEDRWVGGVGWGDMLPAGKPKNLSTQ